MIIRKVVEIIFDKKNTYKWLVVFWFNTALLLYLTLMPSLSSGVGIQNIDKLFHFIGFGAFAFFFQLAFPKIKSISVIISSSILGITVEIIQSFIPYRGFSIADMLADFTGILVAVAFLRLIESRYMAKEKLITLMNDEPKI